MEQSATYKIILFGTKAVGKTSLFAWVVSRPFDVNVASTIAVMFASREFTISGDRVLAQIWDTAGQERYASITKSYYQDAAGGLLIFDLTSRESLSDLEAKAKIFKENAKPGAKVVLVGNKTDLESERVVSREQAETLARRLGASYIETSAKDPTDVKRAFSVCMEQVYSAFPPGPRPMSIVLTEKPRPVKSKCCK